MKVGGRILQNKNIKVHSEYCFDATYKSHYIYIRRISTGHTNEYYVEVFDSTGSKAVMAVTKRCCIHDAIVYALDGAEL